MDKEIPKYGVFIIESMDLENEQNGKLDGYVLKSILDLCDIPNEYFYIRTRLELIEVIRLFDQSGFGFLYLSCHANTEEIGLTFESLNYQEFEHILGDSLYHKRLFLSACEAANFELARRFVPKYHCYSVVGSPDPIDYDKAGVVWSSFYHLAYEMNQVRMPQTTIEPILRKICDLFNVNLNYYSIIRNGHKQSKTHLK